MRLKLISKTLAAGALMLMTSAVQAVASTTQIFTPQSVTVIGNTPVRSSASQRPIGFTGTSATETFALTLPNLTGLTLDSVDITVSSQFDVKVGGFSFTGGPVDVAFSGLFFLNGIGVPDILAAPSGTVQEILAPGIFAEETSFPGSGSKGETRSFTGANLTALLSQPFRFRSEVFVRATDLPFVVTGTPPLVEATLSSSLKVTYNTSPIVSAPVPVPASLPLMLAGLVGFGWLRRRALAKGV